jgi:hypothetical protein
MLPFIFTGNTSCVWWQINMVTYKGFKPWKTISNNNLENTPTFKDDFKQQFKEHTNFERQVLKK